MKDNKEKAIEQIRKQSLNVFNKVLNKTLEGEFDLVFLRIIKLYEMLKVFEETTLKEQ